jgi:lipid II:glycine glycyltransferase (peptidoglycan interpeptide bridge formation enzyme)
VGPPRASLRLDLRPELESIFAGFRKTTRAEIRRAENAGVEVVAAGDAASKEHFVRMYLQMAQDKAFAPDSRDHMRRVLAWLVDSPGGGVLLTAIWKREILGGVVAVRAGSRCWYVWGATSKGSAVNVGHLIQWHAIQWARGQGCSEYDLGGYRPGANDGPALFKKGFSQNLVRFLPTYRYPLNSAKYSVYKVLTPGVYRAKALLKRFNLSRGHRPENR